jgi:hypothetical protein
VSYVSTEFKAAFDKFAAVCSADYDRFTHDFSHKEEYTLDLDQGGAKFIRVVKNRGRHGSVHCFIVKEDHTTSKGLVLKHGDILKAAGYKAPALNFVRGNIYNDNYGTAARWTGAM